MIRRLQESIRIRIKNTLNIVGVNRHQPRHFIILSAPRVGSTLLHTYLNSHWNIISHGEFLGRSLREGGFPDIGKFYDKPTAGFITHTGCKVFYDYTRHSELNDAINKLYSDPRLYIIHLTRKDSVAAYLSWVKAQATGEWTGKKARHADTINVNIEHMLTYLQDLAMDQSNVPKLFASDHLIQLEYESLVDNAEAELARLQKFLGVQPRRLQSVLQKQRPINQWSAQIQNYDEVRRALEDTPWECLLAEPNSK